MNTAKERDRAAAAVLSPLACRLEARAKLTGVSPPGADPEDVCVVFAPWHLEEADRAVWQHTDGLVLIGPTGPTRTLPERPTPTLWKLRGSRAELEALAQETDGWSAVGAAHQNAHAPLSPPSLMGVVNVTPDSFSDGGRFEDPGIAVEHGLRLEAEGAHWLDVGGESTRPGSEGVTEKEELDRVMPVIEGLGSRTKTPISIDTQKSGVARRALESGASMVNDVSALRTDPGMLELMVETDAELCLMHMLGEPRSMQKRPTYADVQREVTAFLRERAALAWSMGVNPSRIVVDPGIGFGKRLEDNLALIRGISELRSLGFRVLAGVSRKSFLSALTGAPWQAEKVQETSAAVTASVLFGATILRVHDVGPMSKVLEVAAALAGTSPPHNPAS